MENPCSNKYWRCICTSPRRRCDSRLSFRGRLLHGAAPLSSSSGQYNPTPVTILSSDTTSGQDSAAVISVVREPSSGALCHVMAEHAGFQRYHHTHVHRPLFAACLAASVALSSALNMAHGAAAKCKQSRALYNVLDLMVTTTPWPHIPVPTGMTPLRITRQYCLRLHSATIYMATAVRFTY